MPLVQARLEKAKGFAMQLSKILAGAAAACCFGTLATSTQSAVVVTNVQLAGPGPYYTVTINGEPVYDDALVLTINGHQVLVNCDDLYQNIYIGQTTTFNVAPIPTDGSASNFHGGTYSTSQVNEMGWLLDTSDSVWKMGGSDEALDLAALQLASWMIGNPSPGATYADADSAVLAQAKVYISEANGQTPFPGSSIEQLSSDYGVQGQILDPVLTPIPEPATWAMVLLGVFGLGAMLRRRRAAMALTA